MGGPRRTVVSGSPSAGGDDRDRRLIDARCTLAPSSAVSRTDLASTPGSDSTRCLDDFRQLSFFSNCADSQPYENIITNTTGSNAGDGSRRSNFPEVTSSVAVVTPSLPFPVDAKEQKASSSASSSTCDSMLELCSTVSFNSSEPAAASVGESPSLPDSGNGSSDAAKHFRSRPGVAKTSTSYCRVASFLPEWDAERLDAVYRRLSSCGFYYGKLTQDVATERLRRSPIGTFLLRDSADERYLFSISVQTCRGTTSIRVIYHAGLFRLDCTSEQEYLLPSFDCVLRLVAHYVRLCAARRRSTGSGYVFLESSGRRDTPVVLLRPLYRTVGRLAHLCRLAVHGALCRGPSGSDLDRVFVVDRLQLIPSLKSYLRDYPYEM